MLPVRCVDGGDISSSTNIAVGLQIMCIKVTRRRADDDVYDDDEAVDSSPPCSMDYYILEACTGTEITPKPPRSRRFCIRPHPVSIPSPPIPAELPFYPHPSLQRFISIPIAALFVRQLTEYGLSCNENILLI